MIPLTNYDSGRSEVVIIYPDIYQHHGSVMGKHGALSFEHLKSLVNP